MADRVGNPPERRGLTQVADLPLSAAPYRGRFAPSPTGALHFGSLIAALGSCLEARVRGGQWLLRMEDVDTPRNQPGAADGILRTLEQHGFVWDGDVLYQSQRLAAYRAALDQLISLGLAYGCACSRREIAESAVAPALDGGMVYPGHCRGGLRGRTARAWRLRVGEDDTAFIDAIQGPVVQRLARDVGDFVLLRADGLFAYQLAVTVDDAFQGISAVVRGADLLASTPRQMALQVALGLPTPSYAHLPVAANAAGEKWSKQTHAPALDASRAAQNLHAALDFLGQSPPADLCRASVAEVWAWAVAHWSLARVPRQQVLPTLPLTA